MSSMHVDYRPSDGSTSTASAPLLTTLAMHTYALTLGRRSHARRLREVAISLGASEEAAARIVGIARATGLWPAEQMDVAKELAAHFADSSDSAESFGRDADTAELIARSKRRGRPPKWKFLKRLLLISGGVLLALGMTHGVLFYRYYYAKPNLTMNLVKEYNARVQAIPENERAWPLYVRTIEAIGHTPEYEKHDRQSPEHASDRDYAVFKAWLEGRPQAVESILAAAARPHLGQPYSTRMDEEYGQAQARLNNYTHSSEPPEDADDNPMAVGILLPALAQLRRSGRVMAIDAAVAAEAQGGERFVRDVRSIYAIAEHAREDHLLISELVGLAIADTAQRVIMRHVAQPGLFTDDQLKALDGLAASFAGGRMSFDYTQEKRFVGDFFQRFYTDDGHGDGRPIHGDFARIQLEFSIPRDDAVGKKALMPIVAMTLPSRAEAKAMADQAYDQATNDEKLPLYRHAERTSDPAYQKFSDTVLEPIMPAIIGMTGSGSPLLKGMVTRDLLEARRDGTLIAIALERYRLRYGVYPLTLNELVPSLLNRVPMDPLAQRPMSYRLIGEGANARPVVYSVHVDGQDDGGQSASYGPSAEGTMWQPPSPNMDVATWLSTPSAERPAAPKGDWVIYPPPVVTPPEPTVPTAP